MNGTGDEMIGSISTFAGNFAPRFFLDCNGQQLPVKEFAALFSILSTTYGGDGHPTVTFGNSYIVDTFIGNQR